MSEHEPVPLKGEFNCWSGGFDVPELLFAVCNMRKTGLLRFESSEGEKTLFLRKGEVIFASSSSADDRLGNYLLRRGKLTLRDLSQHAHQVRPGVRLGTLLVERGTLNPKELVQAVIAQVRAIVLSLFRWTEASYGFEEQELPSKETITLNFPATRLVMDGVQTIDSWRRIAQGVGDVETVYRSLEGNADKLRTLNPDPSTLEVLTILNQPKSVMEVCDSSALSDIDVCRRIWVFRCLGWIERTERAQEVSTPDITIGLVGGDSEGLEAEKRPGSSAEGAAETAETVEPAVNAPVSASLADLEDSRLELVSGDSPESTEDPGPANELGSPDDLGLAYGTPIATPGPAESREMSLESPEDDVAQTDQQEEVKEAKRLEVPSLDMDADLEGLGMVFGEEKKEKETN